MRPVRPFNFNTSAELFPAAIRKKKRAGFAYRRFGTAAEAVRFAIEELPADSLNGAYLQVEEARFDQSGIRSLYESEAFPLERRPRPARGLSPGVGAQGPASRAGGGGTTSRSSRATLPTASRKAAHSACRRWASVTWPLSTRPAPR